MDEDLYKILHKVVKNAYFKKQQFTDRFCFLMADLYSQHQNVFVKYPMAILIAKKIKCVHLRQQAYFLSVKNFRERIEDLKILSHDISKKAIAANEQKEEQ